MGNIWVTGISTVFESRTAAITTTVFAGFIGGVTLDTRFATPCFRWTRHLFSPRDNLFQKRERHLVNDHGAVVTSDELSVGGDRCRQRLDRSVSPTITPLDPKPYPQTVKSKH